MAPQIIGSQLKNVTDAERNAILARYKHTQVEDGFYWDEEDRYWAPIPELWEPSISGHDSQQKGPS
jgi:hypothetical protein